MRKENRVENKEGGITRELEVGCSMCNWTTTINVPVEINNLPNAAQMVYLKVVESRFNSHNNVTHHGQAHIKS